MKVNLTKPKEDTWVSLLLHRSWKCLRLALWTVGWNSTLANRTDCRLERITLSISALFIYNQTIIWLYYRILFVVDSNHTNYRLTIFPSRHPPWLIQLIQLLHLSDYTDNTYSKDRWQGGSHDASGMVMEFWFLFSYVEGW